MELIEAKKITALKPAVRTENRVNVFINEKFAFSLDLSQIVEYKLKIGKVLTPEEIEKLKHASIFGKLYASTLEWVLIRPRSVKETRDHLRLKLLKQNEENKRREKNKTYLKENPELKSRAKELKIYTKKLEIFSSEDIEAVIKKLLEKNYLNDKTFANFYVENRFLKKGISERRLREELRKKGIDPALIAEALETSSRDPEAEIEKIIKKRAKKYSSPEKLLAYLLRQGFPYELSKEKTTEFFEALPPQL